MKFNIENYESMSTEEKLAALEALEIPDMSQYVAKSVFDKKASEAADLGKQLKARMTEDEAQKAQEAAERAALEARVKELEAEKTKTGYVSGFLGVGYDDKTAKSAAEALFNGDMDTVFKLQRAHIEGREKALRAELLKETPPPAAGEGDGKMSKDDFMKLTLAEQADFARENPDAYKEFFGGN